MAGRDQERRDGKILVLMTFAGLERIAAHAFLRRLRLGAAFPHAAFARQCWMAESRVKPA